MAGHGSKLVEGSAEDKRIDSAKGIKEGSPADKLADKRIGKKLMMKRYSAKRGK